MINLLIYSFWFVLVDSLRFTGNTPLNAYIHIPFCRRRCHYCSFPIKVVGENKVSNAAENYVSILKKEIDFTSQINNLGESIKDAGGLKTLYFGGGTPSMMDPSLLQNIIESVKIRYGNLAEGCEVTIEMDPGTFDEEKLLRYVNCGVNRVSIGVQSWNEKELKSAGRAHSLQDCENAITVVQDAFNNGGLKSWSLDLISGLPQMTTESWQHSLRTSLSKEPPHLSIYDLQVEEGTAFGRWYKPGVSPLPSEAHTAEFYRIASQMLGDYEHYEVSSYALLNPPSSCPSILNTQVEKFESMNKFPQSQYRSRHNSCYWQGNNFLGFGLGATSMIKPLHRVARPTKMEDYEIWVKELGNELLTKSSSSLSKLLLSDFTKSNENEIEHDNSEFNRQLLYDKIITNLRTKEGLDLQQITTLFGLNISTQIQRTCQLIASEKENVLYFSSKLQGNSSLVASISLGDPEGFLLSNTIITRILANLKL